jgi:hypothetical protein
MCFKRARSARAYSPGERAHAAVGYPHAFDMASAQAARLARLREDEAQLTDFLGFVRNLSTCPHLQPACRDNLFDQIRRLNVAIERLRTEITSLP